jgi:UDP:flavonoid glycosyltransferase YjiC (YdhE family)
VLNSCRGPFVYVTNGGYGGLHYEMENGVPIVVAGDTEDKPEGSARATRWKQCCARIL